MKSYDNDDPEHEENARSLVEGEALETDVQCPYCGEHFSIVADTSIEEQSYIEDCYVCCRPIQFSIRCENAEIVSVSADRS